MAAHAQVIEQLREEIRRIERKPAVRSGHVASGRPEIDALLPGGGFPRGTITQLAGGPGSGKTGLALSVLAAAMGEKGLGAFIDARGELYPPAASTLGVDLGRLLVVRPFGPHGTQQRLSTALWAAEAILASGAFEALVVDIPDFNQQRTGRDAMLRRVRAAAEKGGALALWLGDPAVHIPAAVRLEVAREQGGVVVRTPRGHLVAPHAQRPRGPETGELFELPLRREGTHHAA